MTSLMRFGRFDAFHEHVPSVLASLFPASRAESFATLPERPDR